MGAEQRVGFIGLGGMGSRMAANIRKAGYALTVYNRDARRTAALKERGAQVGATPREVAQASDVLFIMVSDPAAVRAVLEGADGILAGAREGLVMVNCSTIGPSDAHDLEARASERGVLMVQAPVLGSIQPAEQGELIVLAGGEQAVIDAHRPLLDTIGKAIHYIGSGEQACAMKLAVNGMLLGSIQLFGEVAALATGWGIPRERVLGMFDGNPIISPAVKQRIKLMYEKSDEEVPFALKLGRKDLWLAVAAGYEAGASLPMLAAALETYSLAAREYGDEDIARIAAFLDRR